MAGRAGGAGCLLAAAAGTPATGAATTGAAAFPRVAAKSSMILRTATASGACGYSST